VASALIVAALLALLAPAARGAYDPLSGGATKLIFDKGFLSLLKQNDVKLSATAGARLRAGTAVFPVTGGKLDQVNGRGAVEHEGSLVFQAGPRRIPLRALLLKTTQRHAPFSIKLGGGQLKLAQAGEITADRRGFGSEIRTRSLALSRKVATRLGKKLRLRGVFEAGQPLGFSITVVNPLTVSLQGAGRASLELAPAFAAKLQSLFVAVNPIFPAEHPGPFTLPIHGGALATDASTGRVAMQGALEFIQLGGGQVFWREPELDFATRSLDAELEVDPSPPYGGKLGPVSVADLSLWSASANPRTHTISITDGSLTLSAAVASILNEVFARPQDESGPFVAGEPVGSLSLTCQGE